MTNLLSNRIILEADKIKSLPLATFKNNSLPLEQEGDRVLAFLSKVPKGNSNPKLYLTICEFLPDEQAWSIAYDEELSVSIPTDHKSASIALFDDRTGTPPRFFVFIGYGKEESVSNKLYYFVFDDNWTLLNHDSFTGSLWKNVHLFRKLTLAPISEQGKMCWLIFGYTYQVNSSDRSTFRALKLSYNSESDIISYSIAYTYSNGLRFPSNGNDYTYSNSVHYMGVSEKNSAYDLVVQCVGRFTQNDDVLYIHQIGNESNSLRYSQGTYDNCDYLYDHGILFVKARHKRLNGLLQTNLAIVRDASYAKEEIYSFIRYVREPIENVFSNYKIRLNGPFISIPIACKVFLLDSGNMSDDADNYDLVSIHRVDSCKLQNYVLKISNIAPGEHPGKNCINISVNLQFLPEFNSTTLDDLAESKYIRHTRKMSGNGQTGYFITLFYHNEDNGISYHTLRTDFSENN